MGDQCSKVPVVPTGLPQTVGDVKDIIITEIVSRSEMKQKIYLNALSKNKNKNKISPVEYMLNKNYNCPSLGNVAELVIICNL